MSSPTAPANSNASGKPSRLKSLLTPRMPVSRVGRMVVYGVGGLLLTVPFFVARGVIQSNQKPLPVVTVSDALLALDEGKLTEAAKLAKRLQDTAPAQAAYVQGILACQKAEKLPAAEAKKLYLVAANYLQQARKRDFPAGREGEGLLALGKSLFGSDQVAACRPFLDAALKKTSARQRPEIYRLLSAASLNDVAPQYPAALEFNDRYLAEQAITAEQRVLALLERAHIQLMADNQAGCQQTLQQLGRPADHVLSVDLLAARLLIGEGVALRQQATGPRSVVPPAAMAKFEPAIRQLRDIQARDRVLEATGGQPAYWIGMAYLEQGDTRAALEQFERAYTLYTASQEGFACGLNAAELLARANRDDEALIRYRTLLASINTPGTFQNRWISGKMLGNRLLETYQELLRKRHFASAVELAGMLVAWFPQTRAMELKAQALGAWGKQQIAQSATLPPAEVDKGLAEGRARLRLSARAYLDLAKLRKASRDYPDDLWNAAEQYLAGHAFRHASFVLEHYLEIELRRNRPRALVRLGEALLAQERTAEALAYLHECIDIYPRDASCFTARLLGSQAYVEQGDLKRAEELLRNNLQSDLLTPASQEWRQALYMLGQLHFNAGQYEAALRPLEEAISRYPELPATIETRYLAAQSYQQLARQISDSGTSASGEILTAAARGRIAQHLEAGLKLHEQVLSLLSHQQQLQPLSAADSRLMRNSHFGRGSILFELERFEEAIAAYQTITARYARRPEVLDAYVQLSACYARVNRDDEAAAALVQARIALEQLPADAPFAEVSNYARGEWQQLLETLSGAETTVLDTPET